MHKYKHNLPHSIFCNVFTQKKETNVLSEMKNLYTSLYAKAIMVSVAFHIVDPTFGTD